MNKEINNGYVKKETLLVVSAIALIVGFIGGVILTVYKTGTDQHIHSTSQNQSIQETQNTANEMAARIFELEKWTSDNPDDVESWTQLGHLYFDTNNYDKAIWAYEKSLALNPSDANVITDMGVMYRRNGRPDEAIKSFDRAIEVDPQHEVSRFNKGIVLMHDLQDIKGAIKAWEELLLLNPFAMSPSGQPLKDMIETMKKMPETGGN